MPATRLFPLVALCASFAASPAMAIDPPTVAAAPEAPVEPVRGLGTRLDPAALDALRGGDSVDNQVDIHGQVDGNSAQNTVSGGNTLGGDAFANASGIAIVIQNSGSNVLIQNGMVVNVQFAGSNP